MKWILVHFLLCLAFSCNEKKKSIQPGHISEEKNIHLKIFPSRNKQVLLSEIINDIQFSFLDTNDECMLGEMKKLYVDNQYFILNENDNSVYVFDKDGRFLNKIGQRGRGPEEISFPEKFTLDKYKKEVWIHCNSGKMHVYDYEGKLKRKVDCKVIFDDFFIKDEIFYYHTSKRHNFSSERETLCYNLWIDEKEENYQTYFPYDPLIYPNGGLALITKHPFHEYKEKILYNYVFSDTIYSLEPTKIEPAYIIDFAEKKSKIDLNRLTGQEALEYFDLNPDIACFVQNFIETDSHIRFNYVMDMKLYEAIIDKKTKNVVEGVLINDLLEARINIMGAYENKIIAYINAFDIEIQKKAYDFIEKDVINRLQKVNMEDNPIIIEFELKQF